MKSTARVTNQLSGLVHKTNELTGTRSEYQKRFDMINYEQSERYKQQKKIKEQLARQIQGDNLLDDDDNKFFYDNEYNLPEDVVEYVIKFFDLKDNKTKKQYLDEWTKFYKDRFDFDKKCL